MKMLNKYLVFFFSFLMLHQLHAKEGMWIPSIINAFMMEDMQSMGLELSKEDIYSVNQSSLKDAVVHFGGGCTAELVSAKGLIFTNHHCGYSQIQSHSSVENDYLKNGFWAKNYKEELPNSGLTATLIVRIDDVTNEVMTGITDDMDERSRMMTLRKNVAEIIEKTTEGNHYEANVKSFNFGNEYYMLVTETFKDVRLVGAPPSAIGKFGGDTDNWVWPRHTGDFSVFRIYADENNNPAEYSENNQPYQPKHFFPINIKPKKENDFTMVYGFPGFTEQHLVSNHVKYVIEKENPAKINMRKNSLSVIDAAMASSDELRIQYAAKQSRISNAYKKWIGQNGGLINLNAIQIKKDQEAAFKEKAASKEEWNNYASIIDQLKNLHVQYEDMNFARSMLIEYYYYGPEFLRFANDFSDLVYGYESMEESEINSNIEKLKKQTESFYKNYSPEVDRKIFNKLTSMYAKYLEPELVPELLKEDLMDLEEEIYEKSFFTNKERTLEFLNKFGKKSIKKAKKDMAFLLSDEILTIFRSKVLLDLQQYNYQFDQLMKQYVAAKREMFPDQPHWADANSTLRLTYGKIEGSAPHDGMEYQPFSTIEGIIQKNRTGNKDYEIPQRLLDLYEAKNYGPYAQDGTLPVCFTASNHTTGGNSGSPTLDKNGYLIGINFDRSWESTMSDIMFDPDRCRNIMVDVRYVLWVIDIYAGAGYLLDEMKIISSSSDNDRAHLEIEKLTKDLKNSPQNGELLYQRAQLFIGQNLKREALIDLEAGLKYAPNHEGINATLAQLYFENKKYDVAYKHILKVLKFNEEKPEHHELAAKISKEASNFTRSYNHFLDAYKLDPNETSASKVVKADILRKNQTELCKLLSKEENATLEITIEKRELCQ